jgi:hypothetical protein
LPVVPPSAAEVSKFTLKVRVAGKVAKFTFADEDELFAKAAEELTAQIADTAGLGTVGSPLRSYEAVELVHSRIEVTISDGLFKKRRGGIDVRRSGEAEAWLGSTSKRLIEPWAQESLPDALRREIDSPA